MSKKLTNCKTCGSEISKGAKCCPSCGNDNRKFYSKHKILTGLMALFIIGSVGNAVDNKDLDVEVNNVKEEVAKENNYGEFRDEMFLVSIIKRYNIPREDFDRALEKYLSMRTPHELKTEFWEAPNGDIIYTFDNEIINEYYRYE